MADVKISELPAASTPLAGTEQIPLVQDATTKQITVSNLLTSANLGTPSAINLANATNVPMDEASGVLAVANGGTGTATPALVQGTNVTITGTWPNQTINSTYSGAVTSVSAALPVVSSGGTTPQISMAAATTSVNGYLTSTDWNTFNSKLTSGGPLGTPSSGTATNLTGLPLTTGVTGLLPVANGGTGTATPSLVQGSNITITGSWPNQTIAASGAAQVYPGAGIANSTGSAWGTSYTTTGSGTVLALATSPTFVTPALGVPASGDFSTGTFTWPTFNQNTSGTAAGLSATLAVASGGTGQTSYTDGQLLIGNSTGNTLTKATLTAGANITITNSAGGITIAAAGGGGSGTVTSVSGTGTVNGLTLTGTVTTSGSLTLGGTLDLSSPPAIGGTAAAAGAFTTLSASSTVTLSGSTANGVFYANGSKVLTSGSALTFDGTTLTASASSSTSGNFKATSSTAQVINVTASNDANTTVGLLVLGSAAGSLGMLGAGAPALYTAATELNLMANNASGVIKFAAGGTSEQMRLTSTGLGIGTSSPDFKLVVAGNTDTRIRVDGSSSAGIYFTQGGSNAGTIRGTTSGLELYVPSTGLAATLNSSGNLGLGVTPSAWSTGKALEINTAGMGVWAYSSRAHLTANYYFNVADKFAGTGYAAFLSVANDGNFRWYQSTASGTAGNNATMSQNMTLDASGNLLVGHTGVVNVGDSNTNVGVSLEGGGLGTIYASRESSFSGAFNRNSDGTLVRFHRSGTSVGSVSVTTTATAYNTSSDYRLKNITGALTGYKERLMSLLPKQGTWIADGSEFRGFVAHDFANPYPKSVTGEKDAVDADGNPVMQAMQASSSEVMADLVAMIQEQQTIIQQLQADVATLKGN